MRTQLSGKVSLQDGFEMIRRVCTVQGKLSAIGIGISTRHYNRSVSDLDLIRSSSHLVHEAKSGIFLGGWGHAFAHQTKNKEQS